MTAKILFATPTTGSRDLARLSRAARTISELGFTCVLFPNGIAPNHPSIEAAKGRGFDVVSLSGTGYVNVRNSMIEYAEQNDFSHIIFFDDDQVPLAGWGEALLSTLTATRPTPNVVFGPVISVSDGGGWSTSEDLRSPDILLRAEGIFEGDVYSGNTLIDIDFFNRNNLRFDERFNKDGGEDVDIFRRASCAGAVLAFSAGAIAIEFTSRSRRSVSGRHEAGRTASSRKDSLGRSWYWKLGAKCKAIAVGLLLTIRAMVGLDRRAAAEAAFQFGLVRGRS